MSRYIFSENAFNDYIYWQKQDKKNFNKINLLLKSIVREGPLDGIGKPEKLRGNLTGFYSRRITHEHRLVYRIVEDDVEIAACRYHYE